MSETEEMNEEHSLYLAGMYALHGFLAGHPDTLNSQMPIRMSEYFSDGQWDNLKCEWVDTPGDARRKMVARARQLGGKWEKQTSSNYFKLVQTFPGGHTYSLEAPREQVCVAVVVGTEEVEQYDYSNAPKVKVTRDVIEWQCPDSLMKEV